MFINKRLKKHLELTQVMNLIAIRYFVEPSGEFKKPQQNL